MRIINATAVFLILTLSIALGFGNAPTVFAGDARVVISHVQTGSLESPLHEAVTIYNNSSEHKDITGYCLYYTSATTELIIGANNNLLRIYCFNTDDVTERIIVDPFGSVTLISSTYADYLQIDSEKYAGVFTRQLADAGGHIYLIDDLSVEVDRFGWGTAQYPLGESALRQHNRQYAFERYPVEDSPTLQDTLNNRDDFDEVMVSDDYFYELELVGYQIIQDYCVNIAGLQLEIPNGYDMVGYVCVLIDDDYTYEDEDEHDEAIVDDEIEPPVVEYTDDLLPIIINEILPNPGGPDAGNEYIELFNPNDIAIDVTGYYFEIHSNSGIKTVRISDSTDVGPLQYTVLYNTAPLSFNLVNTAGVVKLFNNKGVLLSETAPYSQAPSGEAWAYIGGEWIFTVPTPSEQNKSPVVSNKLASVSKTTALKPCAAHQYRSPETNRCRNIETSASLTPCQDGYERNPDTNRCRKVLAAVVPSADYPVRPITPVDDDSTWIWWGLGGIVSLALGYAIWEWRWNINKLYRRAIQLISRK